jgi:hypothetical protein
LRRHTRLPSPASTRTVWTLVIPRSMPTNRRSCMPPPCWSWPAPAAPMGGAVPRPRSQGGCVRRRLPLMCCNRPRPARAGPLPSSGASVAGHGWQSGQRGRASARPPQSCTQRHPRNQPGCTCNPGTLCGSSTTAPYMSCTNSLRTTGWEPGACAWLAAGDVKPGVALAFVRTKGARTHAHGH